VFGKIYRNITQSLYGTGIGKIAVVRNIHKKILKQTSLESMDVFGYKLFLHPTVQGYTIEFDGWNEETKIIKKFIKKGDTVIDLGANIGRYTLLFRSLVGENGKVIAFEPDITNFNLLKKTIIANNFENVTIFQKAVGNINSRVKMSVSEEIGSQQISNSGSVVVDCVKVDDYVSSADFVKIDTEGYEIKVLEGMPNLLRQKITMMVELNVKLLRNHSSPEEFFTIMKKNGFTCQDMRMKSQSITESNFISNYKKSDATNVLCIKK
jgi:FkbM family methyltransferase